MNKIIAVMAFAAAATFSSSMAGANSAKPTIVLVHGAFADASSWNGVIKILEEDGYRVVAAANPLRSVSGDAEYIGDLLSSIKTPVVLVGHSYGGPVITNAAKRTGNVKALVYVSAFAPDEGETSSGLAGKFPGSTLGTALADPVALPDGGKDLYINPDKFRAQFAADVAADDAKLMAATQRPVTEAALNEPSGKASWKWIPSWFVYGDNDKNIPPKVQAFMSERAHSRQTVVIKGASHVTMVSHPATVSKLIERAAEAK